LFRVLGVEYLHRYDFAQVPPTPEEATPSFAPSSALAGNVIDDSAELKARGLMTYDTTSAEIADRSTLRPAAPHAFEGVASSLDAQLEEMMGDAPVCDGCGHITVRNGACYKCLNCGNSMGCS
jgi:ribonucleoside-diphosphate reductase alpha chain